MSKASELIEDIKTKNEALVVKDSILSAIAFEELIDTLQANEPKIDEATVKKVWKEILKAKLDDAEAVLKKNMKSIVKEAQG